MTRREIYDIFTREMSKVLGVLLLTMDLPLTSRNM